MKPNSIGDHFDIRFLGPSSDPDWADIAWEGMLTTGPHEEDTHRFESPTTYWRREAYESQWREGVARFVAGAGDSCLLPIKVTGWVETTNEAATFLTTSLGFVARAPGLAEDGDIDGGAKFGALREHSWIKLSSLSQINRPTWLGTGQRSDAPGSTLPIGADTANGHECVDSRDARM